MCATRPLPGACVIWDNRCTMHRASPFPSNEHKREMHRTTIIDTSAEAAAGI
jgi:alpha-ketoglutarate-dependent 2,4-dichlorophenoxyacetate dioxygenase